jgi:hypothetical protein
MAGAWRLLVRIASAGALLLVATYYLLASIAFSYYHFLQFPHFWWMPLFIRVHPVILLAAVAALLMTQGDTPAAVKPWMRYTAVAAAASAACMATFGWLDLPVSYELAGALTFVPLALLAMTSAIHLAAHRERFAGPARARRHAGAFVAGAATTGALCASVYFADATARRDRQPSAAGNRRRRPGVRSRHTLAFVVAALGVVLIGAIAARRHQPRWIESLAIGGWAAVLAAVLIRRSVLTALPIGDLFATVRAVALAVAVVMFCAGLAASAWAGTSGGDGREVTPATLPRGNRWGWRVGSSTLLAAFCILVLPRMLLLADWASTLQKLVVFVTWAAFSALVAALPARRGRTVVLVCALAALIGAVAPAVVVARRTAPDLSSARDPFDASLALDRYSTFDTSLTVLLDVARPLVADGDYYRALRQAADAIEDPSLEPVALHVADDAHPASTRPPNIFFIVVDSLRPDYLSPYNPDATFTPAIGAFARESIVMRRAFTSYGGTALSEPALWAGGLIPRAMYIRPFAPMNTLERLLRLGGYHRYISVDFILKTILEDWDGVVQLDTQLTHPDNPEDAFKFDLCTTLTELTGRLDRDARNGPVFFYSQPQNLHISMLVPKGQQYPTFKSLRVGDAEFFGPAVSVITRLDTCFGAFIRRLKAAGLYDDSIIILTSDHGDAYGDGNRWGHAFFVMPVGMSIPLIMHVPERLLTGRAWDPDAVTLSTDITPTLYDLLGYRLENREGPVGHSLMPRGGRAPVAADARFLIQSSYAQVFGLIDGRGRWMYTAEAKGQREQLYDMAAGGAFPKTLPPADRVQYRKWLLDEMHRLDQFYRPAHD